MLFQFLKLYKSYCFVEILSIYLPIYLPETDCRFLPKKRTSYMFSKVTEDLVLFFPRV